MRTRHFAPVGLLGAILTACEGRPFEQPPIHLNQNMDFQKRFDAQEENPFFADARAQRVPVEGTVAVGHLKTDEHIHKGLVDGKPAETLPAMDANGEPITPSVEWLERGKERYEIFCTPCHGFTGEGNGLVVQRGENKLVPVSLYDERLQGMGIGYFYDVITNGKRTMGPYGSQIPNRDRWAIASYVRVLQRSRGASLDQVPEAEAAARGWRAP